MVVEVNHFALKAQCPEMQVTSLNVMINPIINNPQFNHIRNNVWEKNPQNVTATITFLRMLLLQ